MQRVIYIISFNEKLKKNSTAKIRMGISNLVRPCLAVGNMQGDNARCDALPRVLNVLV